MEKFIITTGKTIDLAVAAALEQLKLDRTSVSVEVLDNPKSGFLGIGATPARIKVTYEGAEETAPQAALSSASRSAPKPYIPVSERPKEQPKAAPAAKPAAPRPERREERRPERQSDRPRENREVREVRHENIPAAPKAYAPAVPGSLEERMETFIGGLLVHMGSDAVPHAYATGEDTYMVDLVGENLGMLIGHRGDTLDAIQHLTNYAVNRDGGKRVRINVDAENYRRKREESLQRLAQKVAGKVVKFRRNITLEPMNAYERHVIHAALQDVPDVTTYSTGTEPNRRIVVAYSKFKSTDRRGE